MRSITTPSKRCSVWSNVDRGANPVSNRSKCSREMPCGKPARKACGPGDCSKPHSRGATLCRGFPSLTPPPGSGEQRRTSPAGQKSVGLPGRAERRPPHDSVVAQWRSPRFHLHGPSPGWTNPVDAILPAADTERQLFGMPGRTDRGNDPDRTGTVPGRANADHQRDARPPARFEAGRTSTYRDTRSQDSIPRTEGIAVWRIRLDGPRPWVKFRFFQGSISCT